MSANSDRYTIFGKTTPSRREDEAVPFAEISVGETHLEVVLISSPAEGLRCSCELWEHTIHELECLSAALRKTAEGPFPLPHEVSTPKSQIGTVLRLFPTVDVEVGYSLAEPRAPRASFFCSSKRHPLSGQLLIRLGAAVSGGFAEVVLEPSQAIELADWLDRQIAELWPESD
jgi:hypothetical protein